MSTYFKLADTEYFDAKKELRFDLMKKQFFYYIIIFIILYHIYISVFLSHTQRVINIHIIYLFTRDSLSIFFALSSHEREYVIFNYTVL